MIRWLALLVLVLGTARAIAQPDAPADAAKRLFDEGRALAAKGKHLEACVLFEKSYELEPAVGTQLNLADCAEREGKPRKAWLLWIAAAEEFERASDGRAKFARGRADALAGKLATVVVRVKKPRTKALVVTIAGREVKPSRELVERVEPGVVEVTASAPCCEELRTTVTAELGRETVVEIGKLERRAGVEEPVDEEDEPAPGKFWRNTAIAGGVGTALFLGLTLYSMHEVTEAEDLVKSGVMGQALLDANAQGERYATIANVSIVGIAVAATVTAVAVVKVLTQKDPAAPGSVSFLPVISPHGAGATLAIEW